MRLVMLEDAPWFVTADLMNTFGMSGSGATSSHTKSLNASEMQHIPRAKVIPSDLSFPNRGALCVSESGLCKLLMRSSKPDAKEFQDWVTKVVLPAIRQDGGRYSRRSQQNTPLIGGCSGGPW